jgi:outer membrane receptor protein involved in Fe transport
VRLEPLLHLEGATGPGTVNNSFPATTTTARCRSGATSRGTRASSAASGRRHFDFVATGNYIGDFRDDNAFLRDFLVLYPGERRTVPSYITLDMQLSYEFVKPPTEPAPYVKESKDSKSTPVTEAATASIWQRMLWGTRLTVGVNDVFDRYPPSVLGAFNDNYDTSLYTIRNRYWYVSLTKKF